MPESDPLAIPPRGFKGMPMAPEDAICIDDRGYVGASPCFQNYIVDGLAMILSLTFIAASKGGIAKRILPTYRQASLINGSDITEV